MEPIANLPPAAVTLEHADGFDYAEYDHIFRDKAPILHDIASPTTPTNPQINTKLCLATIIFIN